MVNLSAFLSQVAAIASERPTYRLGGEGADGTCDCIGLIIGAIERAGGKWKGTHGSNYAARNEMAVLSRQIDATQMELGWAVYKAKAPNESGYALPDKYKSGSDLLDYYHVGVVTGIEPLEITHCTTGGGVDGIATDSKQGKWLYGGPLALVPIVMHPQSKEHLWICRVLQSLPMEGHIQIHWKHVCKQLLPYPR